MRIVVAPDKFKGSLSAAAVAGRLAAGLRKQLPDLEIVEVPVADGGEGTLEAAFAAGYEEVGHTVTGPTGHAVSASVGIRGRQAVIEMAAASGLALLPEGRLMALTASSKGTGELIRHALDAGCTEIVVGVGGSACTDGGAGLLVGLGARLLDVNGNDLPPGGAALQHLYRVDLSGLDTRLRNTDIILASDVDNGLLGPFGAAAVFAPQKGATAHDVVQLESGLARLVHVLALELGPRAISLSEAAGAGAAGGTGYAALAVLDAVRKPGIDVVLGFTQLAEQLAGASLVVTGEGSLDEQTLMGKTPLGVARLAASLRLPVVAVCGRTPLTREALRAAGFDRVYALADLEPDTNRCMTEAGPLVERLGEIVADDVAKQIQAELLSENT
ncbi:glycerate kinase [Arthrobacter agilis]|uniref:glycerate kinase n=1 Tax=Arthrobacter agilis TaxID=37921 RepID=UPI0027896933|nr:glycerate kinase [Arthrobacter agilis]MDQ0736512.1 glycerate kinase [Arthrobacter agilis]